MAVFLGPNGYESVDTRPTTDAEAELAAIREQLDADPTIRAAKAHFPTAIEAAERGDWDACERAIVREIVSFMGPGSAEADLQLSGLMEWGIGSSNDPNMIHDLSWAERQQYIGIGHKLAKASPPVHNALRLGTSYVIGQGIPMPVSADADVQAVIEDVWTDPDNAEFCTHEGQKETDREQRLNGETFIAIFVGDDGHCKFRTIDALRVENVITHPDDYKRPLYYRVEARHVGFNFDTGIATPAGDVNLIAYYPDWRNVAPPRESDEQDRDPYRGTVPFLAEDGAVIAHFPLNRLGGARGVPDMASTAVWVIEHKRFMDARIMIMQAIAKISMIKTVKGGQGAVAAAAATERSTLSGSIFTRYEQNPAPAPGSVYVKNEGIDVEFPKFDTGASGAAADLEALAQMIGTAQGLPTHYILMSTETSRLATAVAMELPVLKMYEDRQAAWRDLLRQLIEYALLQAAKAKRIKAPVLFRHGHELVDWANAAPAPAHPTQTGTPVPVADEGATTVREAALAPAPEGPAPTPAPVMPAVITGSSRESAQAAKAKSARGSFDVSLPKILSRDTPGEIAAIDTAAKGGYITQEQAARMAYELFSYDDISDAMREWETAVDERLAQHASAQQQATEERQQALNAASQKATASTAGPTAPTAPTPSGGVSGNARVPSGGMSRPPQ